MAKKIQKSLLHAQHNEKFCKHIDKTPDYLDWVITSAFYSALHYVRYKIFPFKETHQSGTKIPYQCFDTYYGFRKHELNVSKHEALNNLVAEHCPEIATQYNWLLDACLVARYKNYEYGRDVSSIAKQYLKEIREHCEK